MKPIYLDHNATTPLDPRVLKAMEPFFLEKFGNPSSKTHAYGWEAAQAVEESRQTIARFFDTPNSENVVFTSGATEANNLILKGMAYAQKEKGHFITQVTEHKCVLESCRELEAQGHRVSYLSVDQEGFVNPEEVKKSITSDTLLCSIMAANNEIGTLQPLQEISRICKEEGVLFHTDASQAIGRIPLKLPTQSIDFLSFSGHKIYGPKGVGALVCLQKPFLRPLLSGGGQEGGLRSGTLNVPGIVGLAHAVTLMEQEAHAENQRLEKFQKIIFDKLLNQEDSFLNGPQTHRLVTNINISHAFVKSEDLILALPGLAFSSGSACASGSTLPSYVLRALTNDPERINTSIRLGLGRTTTEEEVHRAIELILNGVSKIRASSLTYELHRKNYGKKITSS